MAQDLAPIVVVTSLYLEDELLPQTPMLEQCQFIQELITDPRQQVLWFIIAACSEERKWKALPVKDFSRLGSHCPSLLCQMVMAGELELVRLDGELPLYVAPTLKGVHAATIQ